MLLSPQPQQQPDCTSLAQSEGTVQPSRPWAPGSPGWGPSEGTIHSREPVVEGQSWSLSPGAVGKPPKWLSAGPNGGPGRAGFLGADRLHMVALRGDGGAGGGSLEGQQREDVLEKGQLVRGLSPVRWKLKEVALPVPATGSGGRGGRGSLGVADPVQLGPAAGPGASRRPQWGTEPQGSALGAHSRAAHPRGELSGLRASPARQRGCRWSIRSGLGSPEPPTDERLRSCPQPGPFVW